MKSRTLKFSTGIEAALMRGAAFVFSALLVPACERAVARKQKTKLTVL